MLSCRVNVHACAGSVIQQDNEPTDGVHDIFWYVTWCSGQLQQCILSSGSTVQIAQAVFLPCPAKLDTGQLLFREPGTGKLLPVPNASHSSSSGCIPWAIYTANTTTSVSTVRIIILWWPCWAAWDALSNMPLSASSWLHGADYYLVVAMLDCMGCTQQHATVSFFMAAWGKQGQIQQW